MRHGLKLKKLNRTSAHRSALCVNMAVALIMNEQIKTTLSKAKVIRPVVDKLIAKGKRSQSLAGIRHIISIIKDQRAAKKLLSVLAKRYEARAGGCTRIVRAGFRHGDMAPMAYLELVDRDVKEKGAYTPKAASAAVENEE